MRIVSEIYSQIAWFMVEEAVTYADLTAFGTELKKAVGTPCTHVIVCFAHANIEEAASALLPRMKDTFEKVTHKVVIFSRSVEATEKALVESHVPEGRQLLEKFKMEEKIRAVDAQITAIRGPGEADSSLDTSLAKAAKAAALEERMHRFFTAEITAWRLAVAQKTKKLAGKKAPIQDLIDAEKRISDELSKKGAT